MSQVSNWMINARRRILAPAKRAHERQAATTARPNPPPVNTPSTNPLPAPVNLPHGLGLGIHLTVGLNEPTRHHLFTGSPVSYHGATGSDLLSRSLSLSRANFSPAGPSSPSHYYPTSHSHVRSASWDYPTRAPIIHDLPQSGNPSSQPLTSSPAQDEEPSSELARSTYSLPSSISYIPPTAPIPSTPTNTVQTRIVYPSPQSPHSPATPRTHSPLPYPSPSLGTQSSTYVTPRSQPVREHSHRIPSTDETGENSETRRTASETVSPHIPDSEYGESAPYAS
ncbi:hypothetical protein SISSUDRAFT_1007246 [Sistotremastrum suecicum HHB10207 ss-3]|uniref:Uncharacterized protein n=1 Tax=Sistotremastrum suecicum HHB10207 ss-3 TaxID=1314776 RepID=A0A166BQH2_9AGAM|nr:hypothetical protein SISSUDRAFT_1007246 [Sistotremastrum suecicum HHB10207 ss-3]